MVPAPTSALYRVFQTKYTALNPPIPRGSREGWSRWDVLDCVTLYGCEHEVGALCEVLAYVKPAELDLAAIFSDLGQGEDPVGDEWAALGHMGRGQVPQAWRAAREMTTVTVKAGAAGWFVDVLDAETIAVLRSNATAWAPEPDLVREPLRVDVSLLTSGRRDVSTAVAGWLRTRVLADGSEPNGIRFASKHGQNFTCWALWVPLFGETRQDRVRDVVASVVAAGASTELLENSPALLQASRLLGVRVH